MFNKKKMAVVIGSQGRCLDDEWSSIDTIKTFLELFDIEYDMFVSTDRQYEDSFRKFDRLKKIEFWEDTWQKDPNTKEIEEHMLGKKFMFGAIYGHYRTMRAATLVTPHLDEYEFIFKMRTDLLYNYINLYSKTIKNYTGKDLTSDNFDRHDFEGLKYVFKQHLVHSMQQKKWIHLPAKYPFDLTFRPTIFRAGDRFMLGPARPVHNVLTHFKQAKEYEQIPYTFDPKRVNITPFDMSIDPKRVRFGYSTIMPRFTWPDYIGHQLHASKPENGKFYTCKDLNKALHDNWDRVSSHKPFDGPLSPEKSFRMNDTQGDPNPFRDQWRTINSAGVFDKAQDNHYDHMCNLSYVDNEYVDTVCYMKTICHLGDGFLGPQLTCLRLSEEKGKRAMSAEQQQVHDREIENKIRYFLDKSK